MNEDTREVWVKVRYSDLEESIRVMYNHDRERHGRLQRAWVAGSRRDWKYIVPGLWSMFH